MRRAHLHTLALLIVLTAISIGAAHAARTPAPARTVTFRLHVAGTPDPRTTFWVSYGPLAGTFGLIRLHDAGNGRFTASRPLPAGRTLFCYIAGTGTVHTQQGPAPGTPMVTIARIGPGTAIQATARIMTWHPAAG